MCVRTAKASFASDVAGLRFKGNLITGRHGLVSASLKTRQLFFRRKPYLAPFCVVIIPSAESGTGTLISALGIPALCGWRSLNGLDDLTSVLWAFINLADLKKPIDLGSETLSKEAAELFKKQFPLGN
jgi:hypothetical protein